ncbi:hypothetical protein ACFE04_005109 [Oxalis oulophora]
MAISPGTTCCYSDVLPFTTLITMECINVGLNTLFKAATLQGMSYHVFIVYAYGIAALVLFPAPFFSHRLRVLPPLTFRILCKIGLLGVIGSSSQIMGYTGISYSSPTLASAISNLTPAFTFILAIIFSICATIEDIIDPSLSLKTKKNGHFKLRISYKNGPVVPLE